MRNLMRRVSLEFNPLLEVNKINLNLIRAVPHGRIRNENMKQRRFTRSRFTRNENMLRGTMPESK